MTKQQLDKMIKDGTLRIVNGEIQLTATEEQGEQTNGEEAQTQDVGAEATHEEQPEHEDDQQSTPQTENGTNHEQSETRSSSNVRQAETAQRVVEARRGDERLTATTAEPTWGSVFKKKI